MDAEKYTRMPISLHQIARQNNDIKINIKSYFYRQLVLCLCFIYQDRLCGLMVRVLDYRSGGRGSIPATIRKK
jgi:hypothetical protein